LVESFRDVSAACVVSFVDLSRTRPTAKIRRREKAVVNLKREEEPIKTPHSPNFSSIIAEAQKKG
jgi:hypothetical protein